MPEPEENLPVETAAPSEPPEAPNEQPPTASLPDKEADTAVQETAAQEAADEEITEAAPELSESTATASPQPELAASSLPADEEAPATVPPTPHQQPTPAPGKGYWLALTIGAAGLLLTLLLPWAQVSYINPLQPLQFALDGAIQFTRDEVVQVPLSGYQLLTFHLWPFLLLVGGAILLFGSAIYWRQTRFLQQRLTWAVLGLGLVVGLGGPVELTLLLSTSQQLDWSNTRATIVANHNLHDYSAKDGALYLCTPKERSDPSCNNDYANGTIVNAGIDWVEINGVTGAPIIRGHAQATRDSSGSPNVTTSGYSIGPLGFMNPGLGYWGAWFFAAWTLLCALLFANRLRKVRRPQRTRRVQRGAP
jgi:hypothetical protein